jgi:hypothetical protein
VVSVHLLIPHALAAATGSGTIVVGMLTGRKPRPTPNAQASGSTVRRHQSERRTRLLRRFLTRGQLDEWIDLLRLRLDTFPRGRYQPIAALPGRVAKRADGSRSRWNEILPVTQELGVRTAVDIGAAEGYFSLQLGAQGVTTVALEAAPANQRTAMLAIRRTRLDNVGLLSFELRDDTVELVPAAECTVFLSLWHHLVRDDGLEMATSLTERIWAKTGKVMFFDTGENEMPPSFGLPDMTPDARTWLEGYLSFTCANAEVRHLGVHDAFDAEGNPCRRNLFAVVRRQP